MDEEISKFVQAIAILSNPSSSHGSLYAQALEYLNGVTANAKESWRLALAVFSDTNSDGTRKHDSYARFQALKVLDELFESSFESLEQNTFQAIQQSFLSYIRSEYVYGSAEPVASYLRNKFSHTLTLFFLSSYLEQWPTFFTDICALIQPPAESSSQTGFNKHVSLLFFHVVVEIAGEVADQLIKSARSWTQERQARDGKVRDAVRERDASRINEVVLTIVAEDAARMVRIREGKETSASESDLEDIEEIVDWGVRTFGSYVGWIDINLTVTPSTIPLLFSLLSDRALTIRLAASAAILRMVSKGLKEPVDKLQLIKVLSLKEVLEALEEKSRVEQETRGSDLEEGEESYREALGRLANVLGLELFKIAEDAKAPEDVRAEASTMLDQVYPTMLHFLADKYDDTSSTVFPLLQNLLASYKKLKKSSPHFIDDSKRTFLTSLLGVLLQKMKYDEDDDPDDLDGDDQAAFHTLRKDLRNFLDSVLVVDPDLATESVRALAMNTLTAYESGISLKWTDAELAIYLVHIFGEINKSGGKSRAAFCQAPQVDRDKRKQFDYSEFPLTTLGEMLFALVRCGISAYPHAYVAMQFFEATARYGDFFKVRKECILPTLEAMMDARGLHNKLRPVRQRVFYLFHKFVKDVRNDISVELAVNLLESLRSALTIHVELPELDNPETQDVLTEALNTTGLFDAQLYLFETTGILISLLFQNRDQATALLLSVVKPLLDDLSLNLQSVKSSQNVLAVMKIHHISLALGNVAKGFPDMPSPIPDDYIMPPVDVFREMAQAIVISLEAMNVFKPVREASRVAFVRLLSVAGLHVTQFIPTLMTNLLSHFEQPEVAEFLNFLSLLVHKLQQDMFGVLDELFTPLSSHIAVILGQPANGTDDRLTQNELKKAYLGLLNNIMIGQLHGILVSERNKPSFEGLLRTMQTVAETTSDPASQKVAFAFLGRCVTVWGQPTSTSPSANGNSVIPESQSLPGFHQYIYDQLLPLAFKVPSLPEFNPKDGQMLVVLHEIASFLQTVCFVRRPEASEFLLNVFLPSQNCPQQAAVDLVSAIGSLDQRGFRKYFTDFVRASKPA